MALDKGAVQNDDGDGRLDKGAVQREISVSSGYGSADFLRQHYVRWRRRGNK